MLWRQRSLTLEITVCTPESDGIDTRCECLQSTPPMSGPNIVTVGIKVNGIAAGARVHAYVARSDLNMGVRSGAKLSYFVDHNEK